ncbi:uncharacterized protein A1O9_10995 [Exophiala aquamarina CBS 119918]|uniref:Phosducin domain-containing protein n=1 Tax=Exophiala aquamarina CBS 119918 TaxID=1182545 RepID=A0A072P085_9EURO|nr:uncharacterized protein A1O9_10995 [Exophiala aquamarina CBS 119918]KEF53087.1 hypothetical protein A1O9_10995 [Exophiala aquamarina CBS 119918]
MADLAREEADRFFSSHDHHISHPEDRDDRSRHSSEDPTEPAFEPQHSDPGTDDEDNMATITATRTTYHLPTQTHFANTGPKGVIADAQSFARAKQTTFRQRIASFASNLTSSKAGQVGTSKANKRKTLSGSSASSDSDSLALSDDEADSDFMKAWRANRLQELASQSQSQQNPLRKQWPSQRSWGTFLEVDANGYLDAIEKVPDDTVVVVMIHDRTSAASDQVEEELGVLACKYNTTRFIRLHHEVAEMESVDIPAVLAYKAGDVIATISGAKAEGLEGVLLQ